jgi:iron-sulfur cluster assembly accessory protein
MSQEPNIQMSESAIRKVGKLIQDTLNPEMKLRVYIVGGGCSGFQYGFKLDDKVTPEDKIIDKFAHIHFLIDENSIQYLNCCKDPSFRSITPMQNLPVDAVLLFV